MNQPFLSSAGGYVIFDITDPEFLPGRIPSPFSDAANEGGPWFFQPSDWNAENQWGGSAMSYVTKFPMIYSPGHQSAEAALADANQWEVDTVARERRWARSDAIVKTLVGRGTR